MQAEGIVRRVLHGPKGEARGALLDDGTIIRVPAKEGKHIAQLLVPGQRLAARGEGLTTELGTVIDAREVGPSADYLHPLKPTEPNPKKHAPKDATEANAATAVKVVSGGRRQAGLPSFRAHGDDNAGDGSRLELGPFRRPAHHTG